MSRSVLPLGLLLLAAAPIAGAGVTRIYHTTSTYHIQSGDATLVPTLFNAQTDVWLDAQSDATAGTLRLPNGNELAGYAGYDRLSWFGQYGSRAELDAAFPSGAYGVAISGGTMAGTVGAFEMPTGLMPDATPALTGDSYSRLQGMRADLPITLATATFGNFGFGSVTGFSVNADGVSRNVRYVYGQPFTSVTIPAGFLLPDHEYSFALTFHNPSDSVATGFGSNVVTGVTSHAITRGFFRTSAVPEPSTVAAISFGALALLRRRRTSRRAR